MAADGRRVLRRVCILLAVVAAALPLLLQACFGPAAPPPRPAAAEPTYLSSPAALAPFFVALDTRQARQPVRILQIGDSHTANDSFSGRMRERLQTRFGAAGRGWLPAGIPFKYFRPALVSVSESGWRHVKPGDAAGLPLGLDAIAAASQPPDATMTIDSTEAAGFDRFAVEFLTRPNGPPFTVAIDGGEPIRVSTSATAVALRRFELPLDRPAWRAELRAQGHTPVVVLGWTIERRVPGVIYENHGTIGATVDLLGRLAPETVSFELTEHRPALLIVAFGTNEGFDDDLDVTRYRARFAAHVEALRRLAHGAPVVVIGPPDGNRAARGCSPTECRAAGDACAWHEPANLAGVRASQRETAAREGWAYWDWFEAMGGNCSIDRMASADPPFAARDHIHLTRPGYNAMADLLFADLMREYEKWKAQPHTS